MLASRDLQQKADDEQTMARYRAESALMRGQKLLRCHVQLARTTMQNNQRQALGAWRRQYTQCRASHMAEILREAQRGYAQSQCDYAQSQQEAEELQTRLDAAEVTTLTTLDD